MLSNWPESDKSIRNCTLPGTAGPAQCVCTAARCAVATQPLPSNPKTKQWLMIGDSISDGCFPGVKALAAAHGIEVFHNPSNAANVWWGAHCLDGWLQPRTPPTGGDSAESQSRGGGERWDVITFQFGLHDLALDNERIEPDVYQHWLANITQRIAEAAPRAKLIWVSTTPVPSAFKNNSLQHSCCVEDAPKDKGSPYDSDYL